MRKNVIYSKEPFRIQNRLKNKISYKAVKKNFKNFLKSLKNYCKMGTVVVKYA